MIPPTKSLLLSVVLGLLLTVTTAAQETELAGSYFAGHDFGGSTITLNADGSYYRSSGSCTYTTAESGTFVVSDGIVRFKILKYTGAPLGSDEAVDLLDNAARKTFFGYGGDYKVESIKTDFTLRAVKWGSRIYLLYDNDFGYFAKAVNAGFEPRDNPRSEGIFFGSFYLREGDEKKRVSGLPSVPQEWQSLLLKKPITAKVVGIVGEGPERIALLNKGSLAGLRVGMIFVSEDAEPSGRGMTEIISVEETFARLRVGPDTKVGDTFTTRYKRREK